MPKLIENDPLAEADLILTEEFYGRGEPREGRAPAKSRAAQKPKPTHYKIVCISLYTEDIERLESLVAELKKRGRSRGSRRPRG